MRRLLFGLGPGEGPRLLAPGHPEWIGTDGQTLGWVVRDRLFLSPLREPERVVMVCLPDLIDAVAPGSPESAGGAGWVLALGQGFVRLDPRTGEGLAVIFDDAVDPLQTRPGLDVGMFQEVPRPALVDIRDGTPLPLPDGALRSPWLRPWARGVGALWVDQETVYRMGQRTSALARFSAVTGLAAGPDGALLVSRPGESLVGAPGRLPHRLDRELDTESAVFSPCGRWLLAADLEGLALVELEEGEVVGSWEGSLRPVGLLPAAEGPPTVLTLDAATGGVGVPGGEVLREGFTGAVPSFGKGLLAGPGGRLWRAPGPHVVAGFGPWREGLAVTDGVMALLVGEEGVELGGRVLPTGLPAGEEPVHATVEGEVLAIWGDGGSRVRLSLPAGTLLERRRGRAPGPPACLPPGGAVTEPGEESELRVGSEAWPVPADGAAWVEDTLWAWSREGMLLTLPRGSGAPA